MWTANVAGKLTQLMIEFANDSYILDILKANPYFENLNMASSIHIGFVNHLFSYHMESMCGRTKPSQFDHHADGM